MKSNSLRLSCAAVALAAFSTASPAERMIVRDTTPGEHVGRLVVVAADSPGDASPAGDLVCEVAYAAGGRGLCMNVERRMLGEFSATIFDSTTYARLGKIPTYGLPSRARVSPDGRVGAFTVFTRGHGYDSAKFSTDTRLVDLVNVKVLASLEEFTVVRDGAEFWNQDFNFWGVTFTPDSRSFYATLSTQGQQLLVRGEIATRRVAVVHEAVECPSLSPDGRRVAYKKKRKSDSGGVAWSIAVLDLAGGGDTVLAEQRSVDDQLEWLDNGHLLYSLPADAKGGSPEVDLWTVPADGSGSARLVMKNASSPSVLR